MAGFPVANGQLSSRRPGSISLGLRAPAGGLAGQDLLVRSDGTVGYVDRAVIPLSAWGYKCDNGITDNTPIFQSAVNALPSTGGTLELPVSLNHGTCAGTIDLHGLRSVLIKGGGAKTAGLFAGSSMNYSGTGTLFNCQSTYGVDFRDVMLQATNASWSGKLIDYSKDAILNTGSSYNSVTDCFLTAVNTAAGVLLNLTWTQATSVERTHLSGGQYNVQGVAVGGDVTNGVALKSNLFRRAGTAAINGPGGAWSIEDNIFEAMASGAPGYIKAATVTAQHGGRIVGNGWYDATVDGTCIEPWNGCQVAGNQINGFSTTASIAVDVLAGVKGVSIKGNSIGFCQVGIRLAATATDIEYWPNDFYQSVTTPVTAPTIAVLAGAGTGATATFVSGTGMGGEVLITTGASGLGGAGSALATITLPSSRTNLSPVVTPASLSSSTCAPYVAVLSANSFQIVSGNAPVASKTMYFYFSLASV